jgi:hypothetical protein
MKLIEGGFKRISEIYILHWAVIQEVMRDENDTEPPGDINIYGNMEESHNYMHVSSYTRKSHQPL